MIRMGHLLIDNFFWCAIYGWVIWKGVLAEKITLVSPCEHSHVWLGLSKQDLDV